MQGSKLARIFDAFSNLHTLTKKFITYGTLAALAVLAACVVLIISNGTWFEYSFEYYKIATQLMSNSFSILAVTIIGCLLADHLFRRSSA